MPRLRALLAILLAATWCSAAWHVDLEAVGLMFEHKHHGHDHRHTHHAPVGADDDHEHEQVFARDVAKDAVRASASTVAWSTVLAFATWAGAGARPAVAAMGIRGVRRETDPPWGQAWRFAQRCAPESAAPPALG